MGAAGALVMSAPDGSARLGSVELGVYQYTTGLRDRYAVAG